MHALPKKDSFNVKVGIVATLNVKTTLNVKKSLH